MEREDCTQLIAAEGLEVPLKSSCTFCSAMKPWEILELDTPALVEIVILEANAQPNLTSIKGLWRKKRMTDFLLEEQLLPLALVEDIWERFSGEERVLTPDRVTSADVFLQETIASYMTAYSLAQHRPDAAPAAPAWAEFITPPPPLWKQAQLWESA
jgi:hypothetical protein